MPNHRAQADVLNRDFLEIRSKILELAASLDRLDRAESAERSGPSRDRIDQLRAAIKILLEPVPNRAEKVQHNFSLEYDADWQTRFELKPKRN